MDPNFCGTLTYICEHNDQGAMGIVINRPVQFDINELFEQLEIPFSEGNEPLFSKKIYSGGPVQQDRGFILHSGEPRWESTLEITPSLRLTTSKDILTAIAGRSGPEKFLIALGYAGWGSGQLEQELVENTWLTCPASEDILFHSKNADKFKLAMARLGIDTNQLNGQIGHA